MSAEGADAGATQGERARVQLGFAERAAPGRLRPARFPSKAGGAASWLQARDLPAPAHLACPRCADPTLLLAQVYAPYEDKEECFHRTIFVFICKNGTCCRENDAQNLFVFRSQLGRFNEFYSSEPPRDDDNEVFEVDKWTNLCVVCGSKGPSHCSKCKKVNYCSRKHQILDWKKGHKEKCCNLADVNKLDFELTEAGKSLLFDEFELEMEEESEEDKSDINVEGELEKIKKYLDVKEDSAGGTLKNVSEEELEQYVNPVAEDKIFNKFKKRIAKDPDQVLRYDRGGQPLWITAISEDKLDIPKCPYCNGERQFEFQIMPQLLNSLNVGVELNSIDWGVLAIYTCKDSCDNGPAYKQEYIIKQDLTNDKSALQ